MSTNDQESYEQGKAPAQKEEPQGSNQDQDPIPNPGTRVPRSRLQEPRSGLTTPAIVTDRDPVALDSSEQDENPPSSEQSLGGSDISSLEDQNVTMRPSYVPPAELTVRLAQQTKAQLNEFKAEIREELMTMFQTLMAQAFNQNPGKLSRPGQEPLAEASPEGGVATKNDDPPRSAESSSDQTLEAQRILIPRTSPEPQLGLEADNLLV